MSLFFNIRRNNPYNADWPNYIRKLRKAGQRNERFQSKGMNPIKVTAATTNCLFLTEEEIKNKKSQLKTSFQNSNDNNNDSNKNNISNISSNNKASSVQRNQRKSAIRNDQEVAKKISNERPNSLKLQNPVFNENIRLQDASSEKDLQFNSFKPKGIAKPSISSATSTPSSKSMPPSLPPTPPIELEAYSSKDSFKHMARSPMFVETSAAKGPNSKRSYETNIA